MPRSVWSFKCFVLNQKGNFQKSSRYVNISFAKTINILSLSQNVFFAKKNEKKFFFSEKFTLKINNYNQNNLIFIYGKL